MIDTNSKVVHLRRVHYACPVERPDRPEPMTRLQRFGIALVFIASALFVIALIGYSYDVLSSYDWHAVGELLGVMR